MFALSSLRLIRAFPVIALIIGVAASLPALKAEARKLPGKATSQEYKLVIKPEQFSEPDKAFARYWEITKKVARESGLEIDENKHPMRKKTATLQYLDDASFSLDARGYILRVTQAEKRGSLADNVTIMLKYRSTDPAMIRPDTVEASPLHKVDIDYQDDVIGFVGSEPGKNLVEHSPEAKFKGVPLDASRITLGDYAALFPTLGKLGLDGATKLVPVGGVLRSVSVEPGDVVFRSERGEAIDAEVGLTFWSSTDGKGLVGEISYSVDLEDATPQTLAAKQKFFTALQLALAADLMPGTTKVAVLYKHARKQ